MDVKRLSWGSETVVNTSTWGRGTRNHVANDCVINVGNSPVEIYLSNCLFKERLQKGVVALSELSTSYHFWSGILVCVKTLSSVTWVELSWVHFHGQHLDCRCLPHNGGIWTKSLTLDIFIYKLNHTFSVKHGTKFTFVSEHSLQLQSKAERGTWVLGGQNLLHVK